MISEKVQSLSKSWSPAAEQAAIEIFGSDTKNVPKILAEFARRRMTPEIVDIEERIQKMREAKEPVKSVCSVVQIHLDQVARIPLDPAVQELSDAYDGHSYIGDACRRFNQRYTRMLGDLGFTVPSRA